MRTLLLILIILQTENSWSSLAPLDPLDNRYLLATQMEYLEDPSGALSIEDIINSKSEKFQPVTSFIPNFGWSQSTYWLKFSPFNISSKPQVRILEFDYPLLDSISVWKSINQSLEVIGVAGDSIPFNKRSIKHHKHSIKINFKENERSTIYIKIKSESILKLSATLWNKDSFQSYRESELTQQSLYTGLLLALTLYNFLIFFSLRDKSYLLYCLCIASILLSHLTHTGMASQWLWPRSTTLNNLAPIITACVSNAFVPLFFQSFLHSKSIHPKIHKTFSCLAIIFFSTSVIAIFSYTTAAKILTFGAMISLTFYFFACLYIWIHGFKAARFLLLAWSVYLLSAVLYILSVIDLFPAFIGNYNLLLIGSSIALTMLAIALADRFHIMQQDRSHLKSELLQQSQSSDSLKTIFLATISHELRTPINGIKGCLEILKGKHENDSDSDTLSMAAQSTNNLQRLIDRLLLFSDAIASNLKVNKIRYPIHAEIQTLITEYQTLFPNLEIEWHNESKCPEYIMADGEKIIIALQQIFDNACKFAGNGQVIIHNHILNPNKDTDVHQLILTVSDNGPGMQKKFVTQVSESFCQIDQSFSRKHGGIGVGLSLSQTLIKTIGGNFKLHSEWGRGTTITLTIPIQTTTTTSDDLVVEPLQRSLNTLVVEDNPINQKVLAAILKKQQHHVDCADNGSIAVDLFKANLYDLILMDCQMPVMDGFEATRSIRKLEQSTNLHTPIIAVTANAMSGDKEKCIDSGMDDYLAKPINPNKLKEVIAKTMDQK